MGAYYFLWMREPSTGISISQPVATETPTPAALITLDAPVTPEQLLTDESATIAPSMVVPVTSSPTATPEPSPTLSVSPPDEIDQRPIPDQAFHDLNGLFETTYPYQDYYETAIRLGRKSLGDRTVLSTPYVLSDIQTFNVDGEIVEATLMALTDHIYFWVEKGLDLEASEIQATARRLEVEYYPRLTNLFGQEWQPGVDNDPHFSILHLVGSPSAEELGYMTNVDEYPSTLFAESNEQEVIYLNMALLELDSDIYYGTLSHELQHLIQWYVDPNESTWLNEGLSQLAELYMGLDTAETYEHQLRPEVRLNTWSYDHDVVDVHYAAAYLYLVYLWEQLGEAAIQELSRHPANGMAAVWSILQGHEPDRNLEQFTADWVAANYLDDPIAGPRYYYRNLDVSRSSTTMTVEESPFERITEINQFGANYIDLDLRGPTTITFFGDTIANLIEAVPRTGARIWLVPGVDDADAHLTAAFDLSGLDQAMLKFSTWYDLEEDYDFAYVSVSADGGLSWDILLPQHASAGEFGPAFNGSSVEEPDAVDGWLKESISLSSYAGQSVLVRFEVLTDYETDHLGTGRGFALDDISVPELGYFADVEDGASGWQANGFVRTGWQLPQKWSVQLIEGGPIPSVTSLPLNHLNQGQWTVDIGKGGGTLAIIPLTPFIDDMATYWLHVEQ